jgi:outer membrane protein OmpA-like peptidoglycan-associated protein
VRFVTGKLLVFVLLFSLIGCAQTGINKTTGGGLAGAAVGSGVGAIIGSATGHAGVGTAIGAGVGGLVGVLVGNKLDARDQDRAQRDSRMDQTDANIAANQRLLDELRRNGVDAKMTDRGVSIHLPDVLFGFNRSDLTRDAEYGVRDIANILRKDAPGREILVEGHTDAVGSPEYNQQLSSRRADTVARELINDGSDRRLISSKGFGESRPISSNDSDSGRARNRRVEIIVNNR